MIVYMPVSQDIYSLPLGVFSNIPMLCKGMRISRSTAYRWIDEGKIMIVKIPK